MQNQPDPATVGRRAAEIRNLVRGSQEYARLGSSTREYPECWATFTGYPIIANWDLTTDAGPLFDEGVKVLCLKSAVYELTGGDEQAAELVVAAPVDEMVHAILAQYTLCVRMQTRLGITFVHMTDRERFGYDPGGPHLPLLRRGRVRRATGPVLDRPAGNPPAARPAQPPVRRHRHPRRRPTARHRLQGAHPNLLRPAHRASPVPRPSK